MTYAEYLALAGGMATCGAHLGVMVAPAMATQRCPPSWIFLELGRCTSNEVEDAIRLATTGRKHWPAKD